MWWPGYDKDNNQVAVEHDDEGEDERHHHHEEEVEELREGGLEGSNGGALPVFRHQRMTAEIEEETLNRIFCLNTSLLVSGQTWGREQRGAISQATTSIFRVFFESERWEIGVTTADSLYKVLSIKLLWE